MVLDANGREFSPPIVRVAFFDLDDTITDTKTDWLWSTWRAGRGLSGWFEMLMLISMYAGYQRGDLPVERLIRYHRFRVGAKDPIAFRAMALRFFIEKGEQHIYKDSVRLIQSQKETGAKVVLLTAQHDVIAAPFAQRLDIDDLVANHLNNMGSKFGEPRLPYCYQDGKVHWARRLMVNTGASFEECAFYTDSINDLPMLEMVGFPVAVNPDMFLEEVADERNWPIIKMKR